MLESGLPLTSNDSLSGTMSMYKASCTMFSQTITHFDAHHDQMSCLMQGTVQIAEEVDRGTKLNFTDEDMELFW